MFLQILKVCSFFILTFHFINWLFYLYILGFPKINPFAFQTPININTPIVLIACTLSSGDKPLSFKWLKNGRNIYTSKDNRLTIRSDDTYSVLELKNLAHDDNGNYTCIANNSHGSDQYTSSLVIKCKWKNNDLIIFNIIWF